MENKLKHLEMIQVIINRMSSNSFALKGWAVTLVAGIFALSGKDTEKMYFLVAYIPIIIFWGLDAYYLLQERLYCTLYDAVRMIPDSEVDFSMRTSLKELQNEKNAFGNCLVSATEIWFYLPLAFVSTGVIILTHLL